jgi:hypothetical protein
MSLSEARRVADNPAAISAASVRWLRTVANTLARSEALEDSARRLAISSELVTRIWHDMPQSNT